MSSADESFQVDGHIGDLYRQIANSVQQAAVAGSVTAFLALVSITGTPDRLWYLLFAFVYAQVPVVTYRRGSRISSPPLGVADYAFTYGMAATNFASFALLPALPAEAEFRAWWWLTIALNALCAVGLVATRLACTANSRHRGWLSSDLNGAGGVTLGSLVIAASVYDFGPFVSIGSVSIDYSLVAGAVLAIISIFICVKSIAQENELSANERKKKN